MIAKRKGAQLIDEICYLFCPRCNAVVKQCLAPGFLARALSVWWKNEPDWSPWGIWAMILPMDYIHAHSGWNARKDEEFGAEISYVWFVVNICTSRHFTSFFERPPRFVSILGLGFYLYRWSCGERSFWRFLCLSKKHRRATDVALRNFSPMLSHAQLNFDWDVRTPVRTTDIANNIKDWTEKNHGWRTFGYASHQS